MNNSPWSKSKTTRSQHDLQIAHTYVKTRLKFYYRINPRFDISFAQKWIAENLGLGLEALLNKEGFEMRVTHYHLCLTQKLLEAARLPIFEIARATSITTLSKPGHWNASLECPWLNWLHPNSLQQALQAGLGILNRFSEASQYGCQPQNIIRDIETAIADLSKSAPPGKSTVNILKAAYANKIAFFYQGEGIFQVGTGSQGRLILRSMTEGDSAIGTILAQNKSVANRLLRIEGIPVPRQCLVSNNIQACRQARILKWPLVVKPIKLDRGEGISLNIENEKQLLQAIAIAQMAGRRKEVVIEEMQIGICHRIVIVKRQLVYAVKRLPIAVTGDGVHTISDLIKTKNLKDSLLPPWSRNGKPLPIDSLTMQTLHQNGFSLASIPERDQIVNLRDVESTEWGGRDEDITLSIHPDNIKLAVAAAEAMRLDVAGVDMMTADITQPWHHNNATINEVNSCPLIGGGLTSKRYINRFLNALVGINPMIPVHVLKAENLTAKQVAKIQAQQRLSGKRTFIARKNIVLDDHGNQLCAGGHDLRSNIHYLLQNRSVDQIIILT